MSDLSLTRAGDLHAVQQGSNQQLKRALIGFEQHFVQEVLKHAMPSDDDNDALALERGPGTRQAQELLHQALAEHTSGSLGISDVLERAWSLKNAQGGAP